MNKLEGLKIAVLNSNKMKTDGSLLLENYKFENLQFKKGGGIIDNSGIQRDLFFAERFGLLISISHYADNPNDDFVLMNLYVPGIEVLVDAAIIVRWNKDKKLLSHDQQKLLLRTSRAVALTDISIKKPSKPDFFERISESTGRLVTGGQAFFEFRNMSLALEAVKLLDRVSPYTGMEDKFSVDPNCIALSKKVFKHMTGSFWLESWVTLPNLQNYFYNGVMPASKKFVRN